MRVIAGSAKGRRLVGPKGTTTRPMMDRAKEALFSSLGERVGGARILDLYAGSGSLGIEALSRGAASAIFVERDRAALDALVSNLSASKLEGTVRAEDVESYLESAADRFDIVFVDPPFATSLGSITAVMELVVPLLEDDARVILHRRSGDPDPEWPSALRVDAHRRYGDSALWQLRKATKEP